jgi:hypothetical protein
LSRGGIGLLIHDLEQWHASGGDCTGEVHSLTSQGENLRSGLNGLSLTMAFFEGIVLRARISSG